MRGDIRSIGMSNATIGLGDSWGSVNENPAGLAMTLPTVSAQINRNSIPDGNVQSYDQPIQTSNFGIVANPYPWGFSLGYDSPHSEKQTSYLFNHSAIATTELTVKDVTLSASRLAMNDRLSIGILAALSSSSRTFSLPDQSWSASSTDLKLTLGLLYQLEHRLLLGFRFSPQTVYGTPDDTIDPPGLPGYLTKPSYSPWVMGFGMGWIPNVNFRSGLSVIAVGKTPQAGLVSDENRTVGEKVTLQPRIGFDYRWIDLNWLEGRISAGSYYEMSRIADTESRVHGTLGFEVNPSVFNLGVALDRASNYNNFTAGIGIDIIRVMRALEFIPPDSSRKYAGFFAAPTQMNADNLPRALNPTWDPSQTATPGKILDIAGQIPRRIEERLKGKPKEPAPVPDELKDSVESEKKKTVAPTLKHRKRPAPRPSLTPELRE